MYNPVLYQCEVNPSQQNDYTVFISSVIGLIILLLCKEFSRLLSLLFVRCRSEDIFPPALWLFVQWCPLTPLLYTSPVLWQAFKRQAITFEQSGSKDAQALSVLLIIDGILGTIPQLVISLYYSIVILETDLDVFGWLSIPWVTLKTMMLVGHTCRACFCQSIPMDLPSGSDQSQSQATLRKQHIKLEEVQPASA